MQRKVYASIAAKSIHQLIYTGEGGTFGVAVRLDLRGYIKVGSQLVISLESSES
jgi:hypothetical protein